MFVGELYVMGRGWVSLGIAETQAELERRAEEIDPWYTTLRVEDYSDADGE